MSPSLDTGFSHIKQSAPSLRLSRAVAACTLWLSDYQPPACCGGVVAGRSGVGVYLCEVDCVSHRRPVAPVGWPSQLPADHIKWCDHRPAARQTWTALPLACGAGLSQSRAARPLGHVTIARRARARLGSCTGAAYLYPYPSTPASFPTYLPTLPARSTEVP